MWKYIRLIYLNSVYSAMCQREKFIFVCCQICSGWYYFKEKKFIFILQDKVFNLDSEISAQLPILLDCQILYYSRNCERENDRGHWIQQVFLHCSVHCPHLPMIEMIMMTTKMMTKAPALHHVLILRSSLHSTLHYLISPLQQLLEVWFCFVLFVSLK